MSGVAFTGKKIESKLTFAFADGEQVETDFRGTGWNVLKVLWGSRWDALLAQDRKGLLRKVMEECVDGEYQTFKSNDGAYVRKNFFGKHPKLLEMEDANDQMSTTNVVIIIGANDVVNPAAKDDPSSPIYGMPILEVEKAEHVIVNKRSMKPGYAGIENDLFFRPKTSMLFGDAKKVLQDLVAELKQV